MAVDLKIREDLSLLLTIEDHERDFSQVGVNVWLIGPFGTRHRIGRQTGTKKGTPMHLDAYFGKAEPGVYELEVAPDSGHIIYPQDERMPKISIIDTQSDNA